MKTLFMKILKIFAINSDERELLKLLRKNGFSKKESQIFIKKRVKDIIKFKKALKEISYQRQEGVLLSPGNINPYQERRKAARQILVNGPEVGIALYNNCFDGIIRDLSLAGMQVLSSRFLREGDKIRLKVKKFADQEIAGRVCWQKKLTKNIAVNQSANFSFGVKFEESQPDLYRFLSPS